MRYMNRLSISALFAIVILFLGSCSNQKDTETSYVKEDVVLNILMSGNATGDNDRFFTLLPELVHKKFPNITLKCKKLTDNQYTNTLRTQLSSNQGPDLFWVFTGSGAAGIKELAKSGYLADLSKLDICKQLSDSAKKECSYNGHIYAYIASPVVLGVYYNKALFKEAGINKLPENWDEFIADCDSLQKHKITPIVTGDRDPWVMQYGLYQIAANEIYSHEPDFDEKLLDNDISFHSDYWNNTLKKYLLLYEKKYIMAESSRISEIQAGKIFNLGQAAMTFNGDWYSRILTNNDNKTFGFFPLPANEKGQHTYISSSYNCGFGINAASKHIEEAKEVLEYLKSKEYSNSLAELYYNSTTASYIGANNVMLADITQVKEAYSETEFSGPFCDKNLPAKVVTIMQDQFYRLINDGTTTSQMLEAMDEAYQSSVRKQE